MYKACTVYTICTMFVHVYIMKRWICETRRVDIIHVSPYRLISIFQNIFSPNRSTTITKPSSPHSSVIITTTKHQAHSHIHSLTHTRKALSFIFSLSQILFSKLSKSNFLHRTPIYNPLPTQFHTQKILKFIPPRIHPISRKTRISPPTTTSNSFSNLLDFIF